MGLQFMHLSWQIDKLATNDDDGFIAPKLPQHTMNRFSVDWDGPEVKKVTDYFLPYDDLLIASNRLGFVDIDSDSDGIFRRVELVRQYQGHVFPSLSFAGLLKKYEKTKSEFHWVRKEFNG